MRKPLTSAFHYTYLLILMVMMPFGLLLYMLPNQTAAFWLWSIPNPRSAMLIGAGFLSVMLYMGAALWQNDWRQAHAGVGGLTISAAILLLATLIHRDTLKPNGIALLVWFAACLVGLIGIPIAAWFQSKHSGTLSKAGEEIDTFWCNWLTGRAIVFSLVALLGFIFAEAVSSRWPWTAGPLEIRLFMAQVAIVGWNGFVALRGDSLWRTHRLSLLLIGTIGLLQLIGLLIGPGTYEWGAPFGLILAMMFAEWVLTPLVIFITHRTLSIE